jgi:phosphoesterase RecJ-like protein
MDKLLIKKIKEYNRIIIHRHKNPDGDAYGAQLGLSYILKANFPTKEIYVVGDENNYAFLGPMDNIEDSLYCDSLVIVVDVCVHKLISDHRYLNAKEIFVLDHHLNQPDFECMSIVDSSYIAVCELITDIFLTNNFEINKEAATCLFTGIITDSGRFLYPNTSSRTLELAASLLKKGVNLNWIYRQLYTEELNFKKLKGYFINNFKVTTNGVAYMMNTKDVKERFGVSTFTVSRAMVNQMANLKDIHIWVNFTEDDNGSILVEMRSGAKSIVHIARKHGGGGHALACGCTLQSFDEAKILLKELDEFNQEN